ncbi:hypothetical protein DAPK24_006520 [Pichia kluyveri]|uniref:C2H2-type domain-containing protein n=1 Tax=Pichia kluyveri TaxID=36015 RepID=A0AAV5QZ58_PICKL|nr:hypothetical protein DAPK24_006520 [Pichia kluyveri]
MEKNQYGRKTWDVEEYSKIRKVDKDSKVVTSRSIENILNDKVFGNEWFKCDLCNRKYKDSLKLSQHFSSKLHLNNIQQVDEKEITLENVKEHLMK